MEKSGGFEDAEQYFDQRDFKRKSKERKTEPVRFYHATPVTTLKVGDVLTPGPGFDEVSLTDSPVPHYTISRERIKPDTEYREARVESGSWRPKWDGTWEVYEVVPLDQVRYHGEFEEYRTPKARIIKRVGNAGAIFENYLKKNKKGGGSKVEHMGRIHGVKVKGRGPDSNSRIGIISFNNEIANQIRQSAIAEDIEEIKNGLFLLNTDEKFLGPDKQYLSVVWPMKQEVSILEKSEESRLTKALITSGHIRQEFTGEPDGIPLYDALQVLRKTIKKGDHFSFSVAVWDNDKSPIPGPEERKLIAAIRKEYPKAEIRFVFRGANNNLRVLKAF